jgi:hypothetical protein
MGAPTLAKGGGEVKREGAQEKRSTLPLAEEGISRGSAGATSAPLSIRK